MDPDSSQHIHPSREVPLTHILSLGIAVSTMHHLQRDIPTGMTLTLEAHLLVPNMLLDQGRTQRCLEMAAGL